MSALAYLKTCLTLSGVGLFLVSGFNLFIDPYGIFHSIEINGVNDEKPNRDDSAYMRRIKSAELLREDYQVVLLGTSRINRGLDPEHPAFGGRAVYNLGLDAAGMSEIYEAFEYAIQNQKLETVVLSLDFFTFSQHRTFAGDFEKSRLSDNHFLLANFPEIASFKQFKASWDTLQYNLSGGKAIEEELEHGFSGSKTELIDHREVFRSSLKNDFIGRYAAYTNYSYSREHLDQFRKIVEYCQNNNIELYLYISPVHVQLQEAKWAVGLYPTFEQWKRDLVAIVAKTARKTGEPAPVLLDFSGYNSITTEAIPELGEKTPMRWYREASHFTEPVGDMVIEALMAYPQRPRSLPADFGVAIDTANIESHLAATREARQGYHQRYPYEVAEVRSLYQKSQLAQNDQRSQQKEGS